MQSKECARHGCSKKPKKKCVYCGNKFCEKHLRAKPAYIPDFKKRLTLLDSEMQELGKKSGGHPCMPFTQRWKKERKKKKKSRKRVISAKRTTHEKKTRRHLRISDDYYKKLEDEVRSGKGYSSKHIGDENERFRLRFSIPEKIWNTLKILIILALALVAYNYAEPYIESGALDEIITSINDTTGGVFSNISGSVDEFLSPEKEQECKRGFEYVNELREQNGRDALVWDDRVYQLAVFRSKDMYERDYIDHVTPEGKCAEDFKKQFNITEYGTTFAENVAEGYHTVRETVDGWMTSRGHKYALLYPYVAYKKAAIGCYREVCTFLVLSTESFICVSGDEGLAYWEEVSKQPGEI